MSEGRDVIRVGAVQAHPVWLDAEATTKKVVGFIDRAASEGVDLLAFPETYLPGYPFWTMLGGLGRLGDDAGRRAYAAYLDAAVDVEGGGIPEVVEAARDLGVFVFLGVAERVRSSVYGSLVAISPKEGIASIHRKLIPTYGERTVWARGDGHGLRVHSVAGMNVGGLNCWENWIPVARQALYTAGEEIHVATWPGSAALNADIPRFIAMEGRVWVVLASGLLVADDVPTDFPFYELIADKPAWFCNGGSSIVCPDGTWAVEPVVNEERLLVADADADAVRQARQSFDPSGHYSRPDVFELTVDRRRRAPAMFVD